uniref:RRM domain-containing protein n=1 Tax=Ananas comosus var. bracteatus TaxID=296719 RepID=A0A6V7QDZ2_ANACO|nr:unnamed protein product [Ananas comosus var. bracteatus]
MEPSPSSSSSSPPAPSSSSAPSRCSEQGKLFVGGIPSATTEEKLKEHFEKYGEVREVAVMRDRITKNGRGFGFVQFADPGAAERVLDEKEKGNHVICGRTVEVKQAEPRSQQNQTHRSSQHQHPNLGQHQNQGSNRFNTNNNSNGGIHSKSNKIFVGGLPESIEANDFRRYFEKFGVITDVVVMYDNDKRARGFGFVTFDSEESVDEVMQDNFHELNGKLVEVKIAVPKNGNSHSSSSNQNYGNYNSRNFQERGHAYHNFSGGMYPSYNWSYGPYHSYLPPPPIHMYYHGGYGGMGYVGPYPGPRSLWGGPGMMQRPSFIPYGSISVYHSNANGAFSGHKRNFGDAYSGFAGFGNCMSGQTRPVMQSDAVSKVAVQMESVKLEDH